MEAYELTESEEYLLTEIKDYFKDNHSDKYFTMAIKLLGEDCVRGSLTDTKLKVKEGKIKKSPIKYFISLLKYDLAGIKRPSFKIVNKPTKTIGDKKTNILKLVEIYKASEEIDKNANVQYIEKSLTPAREINQLLKVLILTDNCFFSQSTNSKKLKIYC
ncbi:hypothetical protein AGMMS49593_01760 [Endomicrobiia bacterium]|nr:hypothetical protein AGMMS49593_01760 [Endomicrobiia bacterium]